MTWGHSSTKSFALRTAGTFLLKQFQSVIVLMMLRLSATNTGDMALGHLCKYLTRKQSNWLIFMPSKDDSKGFPGSASAKESACQCRRCGFNPWVRKIPGEGNGNSLQSSCLENPMDRGVRWATVHGIAKSRTRLNSKNKDDSMDVNLSKRQEIVEGPGAWCAAVHGGRKNQTQLSNSTITTTTISQTHRKKPAMGTKSLVPSV